MNVLTHLKTAASMTVVTIVLLGIAYPLAITGVAQVLFPIRPTASCSNATGGSSGRA